MRGFVVLVVLLMLAVISAVAIGQLSVAGAEGTVSVRKEEEAQARAIAEGCLLMMQRHADYYMGATGADPPPSPPTPPGGDFDLLLNPDGNGGARRNGDEHVPAASGSLSAARRVEIPGNASPPATSQHQYLMVPRAGGACFIRFEDNSDDDLATGATMADTTDTNCRGPGGEDEGTGLDINYCDSDGAIYMTAIGVFPKLGPDGDVYSRAHARVTLRKLYQVAQPGSAPAAIIAGGDVDINNNITVCGVGGIQAADVNGKLKGSSCMCGSVTTDDAIGTSLPLGSTCCPNCNPGSQTSGVAAPRPIEIDNAATVRCTGAGCALHGVEDGVPESPMQPQPPNFMGNQIFGNPRLINNNIGDPASCKLFLEEFGSVFYWDRFDTGVATMFPTAPNDNCANYTRNPVGMPCTWAAGVPTCVGSQTACWKPLAIVGNGAQSPALPSAVPEMTNAAGTHLNFNNNALPNSANAAAHFGAPNDANKLCGSDPVDATTGRACVNCGAAGSADTVQFPGGVDVEEWVFTGNANNNNMPVPLIMAIGPNVNADVQGSVGGGTPNGPLIATITTEAALELSAGSGLCCHNCGCTEMLAAGRRTLTVGASPAPPAATTVQCTITAPNQGASYPNPLLPQWARFGMLDPQYDATNADGPMPKNRSVPSFVAYADQNFKLSSSTYVGLLWGAGSQTFTSSPSLCVVGRWVVDGDVNFDRTASVNIAGEWLVTNNVDGDDAVNGVTVNVDTVFVENDASFKNNWVMNGRFIVGNNLAMKNSATINFFGGGAEGAFGTGALSSFMESQW